MQKLLRLALLSSALATGCTVYTNPNPNPNPNPQGSVPGAPSSVAATAGNATASVSWAVPPAGSSPITQFIITVSPGGWQVSSPGASNAVSVEGLSNSVSYTFVVQAANAVGISAASPPSNPVVPTGPAPQPQTTLGPMGFPGYHVLANAATSLPTDGIGYLVTANGQGGYRVFFTDTANSAASFTGTITTDQSFDAAQTTITGSVQLAATGVNQYSFSAVPGATVVGFDVVAATDPIYLDAQIDGQRSIAIYFTGAASGVVQTSAVNPVAFTSP